jgi:hypothetical protein
MTTVVVKTISEIKVESDVYENGFCILDPEHGSM